MIDKTVFENKIAAYYTLGCKLNFAETSTIGKVLAEQGVRKARPGEKADICVVNTCSVTELADKKCRQAIRRIGKQHPGAFIVVTGCYAQLKPEEVSHIEGVDLVLGAEQKLDLLMYLDDLKKREEGGAIIASRTKDIRTFSPSCSADDRTRHFLKVQDGCDYFCSYCTIPFARGRSRNGTIASMVKQAEEVASNGGKEIVLTGVTTSATSGRAPGKLYRPDPRPRQGGRDRTLPYLLHRTEPDHGRGDRFRGMQQTFRSSFSYSVTERKRRGAETDAPPLRHDPVPA